MSNAGSARSSREFLFVASSVAIVSEAISFAVRADIMGTLSQQFHLTNTQIGWIAGAAFWGFTVSMFLGGQVCEVAGMGWQIVAAFVCHVLGVAFTMFAHGFAMLYFGTLTIGLANGLVEATANPLIATLYPERKTDRLNALHVWYPGGIVLGGLAALLCTHLGLSWQIKTSLILIPTLLYGALFLNRQLPPTERKQHQIPTAVMYREALRPGFLLLLFCIVLTAATELGPTQWIPSLLTRAGNMPGILILVWITGLMAVGRYLAGVLVSRISPVSLLLSSTILSATGLFALGTAHSGLGILLAASLFAIGICYCWPTMYGITSEKFPAGGGFLLALMGSVGMLSGAFVVPAMGRIYDVWGSARALRWMAILPAFVAVIFAVIWWHDRAQGGYRAEQLADPLQNGVPQD
jgi:fucose permease